MDPSGLAANSDGNVARDFSERDFATPQEALQDAENSSFESGLQAPEAGIAERNAEDSKRKSQVCKTQRGWRKIVLNFTPS
jgi:hypothetical protein